MVGVRRELEDALRERYFALHGRHPMTADDDRYVDERFVTLDALAAAGHDVEERFAPPAAPAPAGPAGGGLGGARLAGELPLPSSGRWAGALMAPAALPALVDGAGGLEQLPRWFASRFPDSATAVMEW